MLILLADSGSSKTSWLPIRDGKAQLVLTTRGINPVRDHLSELQQVLADDLIPLLEYADEVREVHFFGAGCTPERIPEMQDLLQHFFPWANIEVASDMLGAAIALCGHDEGIACILGTGSNSCLYDGRHIVQNISPLGWILGDEGSGAVLGRSLIGDLLKGQLSHELYDRFVAVTGLTQADIIDRVYRQPHANTFLATLVSFIDQNKNNPEIHDFLLHHFGLFLRRNVLQYHREDLPVHFVGGVAWQFQNEIRQALADEGLVAGHFLKTPIERLAPYFVS